MADLTTKTKVKSFLGISGSTYDTILDTLCKNVSAQIERYCNRSFTRATYTEYFDTKQGESKIFLRNFPIVSLTTVKYRTGSYGSPTWTSFGADDYLLSESLGKISFAVNFPEAEKYLEIIYVGGYLIDFATEGSATHTLPSEIEQCATEWVASIFNTRKAKGVLTESTEGQSITFKETASGKEFLAGLSAYRNLNI